MAIFLLLISFIIGLFCFHTLVRDDYLFLRKNLTLDYLFDVLLVASGVGLLTARIFFVAFHFDPQYINPLVFLLFPYFPGLSLFGGILGVFGYITLVARKKKISGGRFTDYVSFSFLLAMAFGFFMQFLISGSGDIFAGVFIAGLYLASFLFFRMVLHPKNSRGEIKDGSLSLMFLIIFTLTTLLSNIVVNLNTKYILSVEDYGIIITFVISFIAIIRHELYAKPRR